MREKRKKGKKEKKKGKRSDICEKSYDDEAAAAAGVHIITVIALAKWIRSQILINTAVNIESVGSLIKSVLQPTAPATTR